ncbi:MAG: hypothetical protein KJT03_04585, partial [Verrucomicrobiae bacterium]|nr:hypothetical protein [Verrucomicrobiae bacterium]
MKLRTVLMLGFLMYPVWLLGNSAAKPAESPSTESLQRFDAIPLHFEENRGQLDERVGYVARGLGYQLMLTPDERVMMIYQQNKESAKDGFPLPSRYKMPEKPQAYAVRMRFEGANEDVIL